jgi:hypothetical protein
MISASKTTPHALITLLVEPDNNFVTHNNKKNITTLVDQDHASVEHARMNCSGRRSKTSTISLPEKEMEKEFEVCILNCRSTLYLDGR